MGAGTVREVGMDTCTRLYLKWGTSKALLSSTGNPAQVLRQPGREGVWGSTDTCVCVAESLCCPPETITTLLTGNVK